MRFSAQLSLEECTVSKPCRLLDFFSSPSAFSSYLGLYLYILLFSLLIPWLSLLHRRRMQVAEPYTSYHGRQARCHSKEPSSCELPIYIAEVTFYTKRAIAVI